MYGDVDWRPWLRNAGADLNKIHAVDSCSALSESAKILVQKFVYITKFRFKKHEFFRSLKILDFQSDF